MNSAAATGIKDVLNKFNDEQLFGLARTTTQGLLKGTINNREDAIEIILKYSPNELNILRRRAVTKDILFSYLHDNKIQIILPFTKDNLIDQICDLWKIQNHELQPLNATAESHETEDENDVNAMATQFSKWFYEMMNQDEQLETSHFFPDAAISIAMTSNGNTSTEETCLPDEIVKLLYNTKKEHGLHFNPNLNSEGVCGVVDRHGLVIILVCGTLHSSNMCIGVFEQMFSLARDPACENNWKVKMTKLNLRGTSVSAEPTLNDSNFLTALVPLKYAD